MLKRLLPILVALLAVALLGMWLVQDPARHLAERLPGADRVQGDAVVLTESAWKGKLTQGAGAAASNFTGAWFQFRGPNHDGISTESTPLAAAWPDNGPPVLWKLNVGEGFAGPAIRNGRVYLLDYDRDAQSDVLRCLSLADGKEIWNFSYPAKIKRNHGMSRTVPTVTEKYAISLGPKCDVVCVDPVSGEFKWHIDMVKEFGTEVPPWYAGQCPFVDGERLILGTGGNALIVAVDSASGKIIWKSPNPRRWQMTHSSIAATTFKGKRMYVYCASGGVAGVSAENGELLWEYPDWKITMANIPTPVPIGEDRIFLSGGYNAGSMMLQLKDAAGKITAEPLFRLKPAVFGATQHTPILFRDHIFGVRPDGQFVCLDLNGKPVWESGAANKFGSGPFMLAQNKFLLMNDHGLLTMAEASLDGYKRLAQSKLLEGPDSWAPLALADGRLIVRDMNQMLCLDISSK